MQKVCLSLIFVSVLAYGAHEKKEYINVAYDREAGIFKQLLTKRPVEQDVRTRYNIPRQFPYYGGKQLEVNWSQLGHISAALLGPIATYATWHVSNKPADKLFVKDSCSGHTVVDGVTHKYQNYEQVKLKDSNIYLMRILATACTTYFGYKYYNSEQKNPFRMVDAPKTVSTEESDQ